MWATYQHDRVEPIRDGRVFTSYTPDLIQQENRITNNETYRQYLMEHTDQIIRKNFEAVSQGNHHYTPVDHGPPFLFTLEEPDPKPFGYEDTVTKQMYLTREQLDQKKRRLLTESY